MFDGRWRDAVDRSTGPVGTALHRRGITADVLTATGLVSASATAVAVATGHLHIAIVLLILTGLHDLLDGPVAKAAGTSSVRGAFFDSVTDRVADALLMGGVAWYLIVPGQGPSGHPAHWPSWVSPPWSPTSGPRRSRSGISAKGGLMERAERMILLGIAFLDSAFLVPVLWVMLVLISITAVARFVKVWKLASASGRRHGRRRSDAIAEPEDAIAVGWWPGATARWSRAGVPGAKAPACPGGHWARRPEPR